MRSMMTPAQIRRMFRFTLPPRARELYRLMTANRDLFVLYTAALLLFLLPEWLLVWLLVRLMAQPAQPPAVVTALRGAPGGWPTGDYRAYRAVDR